jgi:uncharacterized protein
MTEKPLYHQDIHFFSKHEKKFVYLTRQMVALLIDDLAFDILNLPDPILLSKLSQIFTVRDKDLRETIKSLCKWKVLGSEPPVPLPAYDNEKSSKELAGKVPVEIWLSLANDCNLRCKYCSAGYGLFGGQQGLMTEETAARGIDLLFYKNLSDQETGFVNVVFVGGEPLLNYSTMAFSVEYAKQQAIRVNKKIRFHLSTNGTLLKEHFQDLFLKNNFEVSFSIDGTAENHDLARPYANKKGSYSDIINNFIRFRQNVQKPLRVQAVLSKGTSLRETMTHLLNLGFDFVIPNPEYDSNFTGHESSFDSISMEKFAEEYDRWSIENIEQIINAKKLRGNYHLIEDLKTLHHRKSIRSSCGAGRSLAVSAHGGIFPCQTMIESQAFNLGHVSQGVNIDRRLEFIRLVNKLSAKCRGCWIEGACARACFNEAYNKGFLDATEPTQRCALYRSYFETAIYGYYLLDKEGLTTLLS